MKLYTIALFGEAERGEYKVPYFCQTMEQLLDNFGNPPKESRGIYYAIQALMYKRMLIFFRVKEEGFSYQEYLTGLHLLQKREIVPHLSAICLPGVGDQEIIQATNPICALHHTLLITNEADLYDYLTEVKYFSKPA